MESINVVTCFLCSRTANNDSAVIFFAVNQSTLRLQYVDVKAFPTLTRGYKDIPASRAHTQRRANGQHTTLTAHESTSSSEDTIIEYRSGDV
jgi:uncharacterized protein (DUF58 family)